MKLNITKTTLAVALLGLSGVASAAMYSAPPAPAAAEPTWHIGVELAALSPVNDDLHFAETNVAGSNSVHVVDPDFDLGVSVDVGYHFDGTNDFTVNWSWFEGDDSNTANTATLVSRFNTTGDTAVGHAEFETNVVNFEFGHTSGWGNNTTYRLHGGVQIADLDNAFQVNSFSDANPQLHQDHVADSEFTGVGPRFGADGAYDLGNGFSFIGHGATALLIGDLDTDSQNETFNASGVLQTTTTNTMSETVIVPEAEGRLGVRYDHQMDEGTLSFEGGYKVVGFFDSNKWLGQTIANNPWPSNLGEYGVYLSGRFTA